MDIYPSHIMERGCEIICERQAILEVLKSGDEAAEKYRDQLLARFHDLEAEWNIIPARCSTKH